MRRVSALFVAALSVCGCVDATRTTTSGTSTPDRDNSVVNERDRSGAEKTPLDQNENQKDINLTANIRRQVVDSKMSVNAQNIKIITQDGKVTLRGPVATSGEKSTIDAIARKVAGETMVENQIDVTESK